MTKQGSICGYQISFSKLWEGYTDNKEALQARNQLAKKLKRAGIVCFCSTLPNQMKKYDGFGLYNGGVCNIYMITVHTSADMNRVVDIMREDN